MRAAFELAGEKIAAGRRATIAVALPNLSNYTPMSMPVHVRHGRRDGPVVFLSAAIHGDEINGIEIIRRVLKSSALKNLRGTLVAIPIVNVFGFLTHSRYLPDRRDLNRSFPGSKRGSLTSRVAYVFGEEIVRKCTHGIDLHTGANHRINHPHLRADLDDPETERLARAFGTPVVINANLRDGSLRQFAAEHGIPTLLYEAGEALRFNKLAITAGVKGVLNVLRELGMIRRASPARKSALTVIEARSSSWVRAPVSGVLRLLVEHGARVEKGDRLGVLSDSLGENEHLVIAPGAGIVIGHTQLPVINEGDALFHVARFEDPGRAESAIGDFLEEHLEGLGPGDYSATDGEE